MRVVLWVMGLVALATAAALAGSQNQGDDVASKLPRPSVSFCAAAGAYDQAVSGRKVPVSKHAQLTHAIATAAPKDTKTDAEIVWQSFVRLERGDRSVVDNVRVKNALDHVLRRAGQDCGWYRRKEGL